MQKAPKRQRGAVLLPPHHPDLAVLSITESSFEVRPGPQEPEGAGRGFSAKISMAWEMCRWEKMHLSWEQCQFNNVEAILQRSIECMLHVPHCAAVGR